MKRDFTNTSKDYRIERFLFKFLTKQLPAAGLKRQQLLEKTMKEINEIRKDVFEKQILRIFDFTAWVESLIRKIPLSEVLYSRMNDELT
jgi:hypothetical protein